MWCGDLERSVENEVGVGGIWEFLVEAGVRPFPPEQRGVGIPGIVPQTCGSGAWGHGQWGCGGLRAEPFRDSSAAGSLGVITHPMERPEGWELLPAEGEAVSRSSSSQP